MLDKIFIQKKMDMLSESIDSMAKLIDAAIQEIKQNKVVLAALERFFQKTVDTMIDINTHIIKESNLGTVDDLQSTFKMLGDSGILEKKFADKIAPIVGARNMLVHRYEKLDNDMFLNNLKDNFSDFKNYLAQINAYLDSK